jgi:hypothetical protein
MNTDISELISSDAEGQNFGNKMASNHEGFKIVDAGSDSSHNLFIQPKYQMNPSNYSSAANSPTLNQSPYKSPKKKFLSKKIKQSINPSVVIPQLDLKLKDNNV